MGLAYGILIARQTLEALATEKSLPDRLTNAWLEIGVMDFNDVFDFGIIEEWNHDFASLTRDKKKPGENTEQLATLSLRLVHICIEIIVQNSTGDSENSEEGGGN